MVLTITTCKRANEFIEGNHCGNALTQKTFSRTWCHLTFHILKNQPEMHQRVKICQKTSL